MPSWTILPPSFQVPLPEVLQLRHVPGLLLRGEGREVQEPQDGASNAGVLHYGERI